MNRELFERKYIGAKILENGKIVVGILVMEMSIKTLDEGKEPKTFWLLYDRPAASKGYYSRGSFTRSWTKYPADFDFSQATLAEFGVGKDGVKICRKGLKSMKDM